MITQQYVRTIAEKGTRMDGRALDKYREIFIESSIASMTAEGSARVKIGDTEVVAGVKLDLVEPYSDKPDEGSIMVNVEMIAMGSRDFEAGPPSIDAIELSRVTDRGIRESGAIDFKKLCVKKGEKVWMAFIDIYPINADGNIFDAATLAAVAAIKDAVFPKLDENGKIDYKQKTKTKLPLVKEPISCTVLKVGSQLMVDPNAQEEKAASARLTVVFMEDGTICAMQKGGNGPLSEEDVANMVELAHKSTEHMRGFMKK